MFLLARFQRQVSINASISTQKKKDKTSVQDVACIERLGTQGLVL